MAYINKSSSWRNLYLWTSVSTMFYCVLMKLFVTESPRWLLVRGRTEEAVATLACIPDVKGISMLARDLQSIVLYDLEGKFAGVRRPNSKLPINIDGSEIVIVDAIGSSGLDLKTDPGVPVVYAGFGALMITTCISYLSHSQIWALQDGTTVFIGGKTNRAKVEFPEEMNRLLDKVPEIVESSLSKKADSLSG